MEAIKTPAGVPSTILDAHEFGFSVFPIRPGTKKPLGEWAAYQTTRPSRSQVEAWARAPKTSEGYCIACGPVSGIVVVDTDDAEAESWAQQHLPRTPWMTRTRKGMHRFYLAPAQAELTHEEYRSRFGNREGIVLADGYKLERLDVRGEGGYVVGPGSRHPDGGFYMAASRWDPQERPPLYDPTWFGPGLGKAAAPPPPPARAKKVVSIKRGAGRLTLFERAQRWLDKRDPAIYKQKGNPHAYKTAGRLRDKFSLNGAEVRELMVSFNQTMCWPPFSPKELETLVASAMKAPPLCFLMSGESPASEGDQWTPADEEEELPLALGWAPDSGEEPAEPETLPLPLPLEASRAPELDTSILPREVAEFTNAMSHKVGLPPELLAFGFLGLLSAILQGEFEVEIDAAHIEPVTLWLLAFGRPGEGKSPALRSVMAPAYKWEREQAELARERIDRARAQQKVLEIREEQARTRLKKKPNDQDAFFEFQQASVELAGHIVPCAPAITFGDITTEALGRELVGQRGRGAVIAAEAGIIDNMAGRYGSGRPNVDLWLAGYDDDRHRLHRTKREGEDIPRVLITLSLMVQPRVWPLLLAEEYLRAKGTYDRFLFACPDSRLGYREHPDYEVPPHVFQTYHDLVHGLLRNYRGDGLLPPARRRLKLCRRGRAYFIGMKRKLEPLMAEGSRFEAISGWVSKLPGKVARLAALLFIAERSPRGPEELPVEYLERAFYLAEGYLIPHAERAFGILPEETDAANARRIVARLLRHKDTRFTRSMVYRICDLSADALDAALDMLTERRWLFATEAKTSGRPKTTYTLNPRAADVFPRPGGSSVSEPTPPPDLSAPAPAMTPELWEELQAAVAEQAPLGPQRVSFHCGEEEGWM